MDEELKKLAKNSFIMTFVVLATVLASAAVVIVVLWPDPPDVSQGKPLDRVRLSLDDEHTAAWISHDNAFTHRQSNARKFRSGVVFQLGKYRNYRGDRSVKEIFTSLEIIGTKGKQTFKQGEFDWINIVGKDDRKTLPPIEPGDVGLLYPDPSTPTECSDTENAAAAEEILEQCVRLRRIDARFVPTAVITYWQGINGYDIEARTRGKHNRFDFLFKDEITVTVYKNGQSLLRDIGVIQVINLYGGHDGGNHGEVHDPGMGGGRP